MNFKYDPEKEKQVFQMLARDGFFNPGTKIMWEKEFAEVVFEKNCGYLASQVKLAKENWENIEKNYLEQMSKFFERKCVIPEEMTCYLVRYTTFPYSIEHNWFNSALAGSPSERNRVIMHELCHFFTPKDISRSIKEAIPVILNDNETFKMYAIDRGSGRDSEEMRLRPIIFELFKSGKTYNEIISQI